ncbi:MULTISPECIES: hypothetical protein [unclassified Bacillus (in: firmicutes)]|uniref:hypothetical protein n=1 Tax=unclassified Bacillus (in: firmicutes) TaxID=185979 RepID=UPI0008F09FA2|nr:MULTISPECIES: hypothetical protein [unclassified Bacillus (in: firmicutes)]SFB13681.1 hypothetical protein SAMN02799634_106228 [Bacillus sp. UNCCL13]SFQ89950.1 hypothetical protein SAMN04488577_3592 [Bacillus sp. cl95]
MVELKLKGILRGVKSEDPAKRFEAMDQLYQYKLDEGLEVQIDVLKDFVKTAASRFPDPVDKWDNPSYYLIDFVCDFPMPEVIEAVLKHFDGFHLMAKERAIEFLLPTEDDVIFSVLEDKIIHLIQTEKAYLPVVELGNYPTFTKGILDKTIEQIQSPHYKFMMYELILSLHKSGLERSYNRNFVLPLLISDYQNLKEEYLKYDKEYTTKFVYTSWKDSYFSLRDHLRLLLNSMEFYFSTQTEQALQEALHFNDPLIRTEALLVCVSKNLPYEKETLRECAEHIESAEMVYWELSDQNKAHLYPITTGKQKLLAKTRLFTTIINLPEEDGFAHFPEEIKIVDEVQTENAYGQPIRYYLMRFKEGSHTYVGWTGGYALEDGDDTAHLWDGTYTDYVEFDSLSLEEHKAAFFKKREAEQIEYENTVYYESKPKVSKGLWFFYAILITQWVRALLDGIQDHFVVPLGFTVLGAILTVFELNRNKKRSVAIVGKQLLAFDGNNTQSIDLAEIRKVEYNKKYVLVYDRENKLSVKFPLKWVRYDQFYVYMREHTSHLKNIPYIQD